MGDDYKCKCNGRGYICMIGEEKASLVVGSLTSKVEFSNDYSKVVGPITLHVKCRLHKNSRIMFGKWLGLLPRPKTTYKTIRKQCAKRNR